MNKELIALVLVVVLLIVVFGGNIFSDAQSKCLNAVEKGKEAGHINPDQDQDPWRTGPAPNKVYVYKGKAYRFYYNSGNCKIID